MFFTFSNSLVGCVFLMISTQLNSWVVLQKHHCSRKYRILIHRLDAPGLESVFHPSHYFIWTTFEQSAVLIDADEFAACNKEKPDRRRSTSTDGDDGQLPL